MIRFKFSLYLFILSMYSFAGEGLWIPFLLENHTITDMQASGLKLSATDIYSVNQACLKDAVVMFGKGCTGEVISPGGLLITNHHCGYGRIQSHSTVEKDYLTDGFWAFTREEELPNPGLTVSFLVRIEDVTGAVLDSVTPDMDDKKRAETIRNITKVIVSNAVKSTHYEAEVESFDFGMNYYLFVYELFKDVRLVGAPPSAIGRFGGDTDNWIWPRHTGDFSLFRIYAGKDNKPAEYSPENVPYSPKKFLTISTGGIHEGDFTMVIGYPAKTDEYLYSGGLSIIARKILPAKIKMREARLRIMSDEMSRSREVQLQYANKYQGTSNAWKKWTGVVGGVKRTGIIDQKIQLEERLASWLETYALHAGIDSLVLQKLSDFYTENRPGIIAMDLSREAMNSFEMIGFASGIVSDVISKLNHVNPDFKSIGNQLKTRSQGFFRDVNLSIDRQSMSKILDIYFESVDSMFYPSAYSVIRSKFKGDIPAYVNWLYNKSLFTDSAKLKKVINTLSGKSTKKLLSDPAFRFYLDFSDVFYPYYAVSDSLDLVLQRYYRDYLRGLRAMDSSLLFYPDANFTMRVAYGKVEGYKPADAVIYKYNTTLKGVIEKENPAVSDYKIPEKLRQLYEKQDYGHYGVDAAMPVCFIASNHTSGGNSGSPVLNAEGELIGINFDRNWEGTISDYEYDPAVCRNISLDIRYVLFIIDKFAGASNILQELIIK
jgi:hypothetical protein